MYTTWTQKFHCRRMSPKPMFQSATYLKSQICFHWCKTSCMSAFFSFKHFRGFFCFWFSHPVHTHKNCLPPPPQENNDKQNNPHTKRQLLTGAQSGSSGVPWTSHWRRSAQHCRWHAYKQNNPHTKRQLLTGAQSGSSGVPWTSHWRRSAQRCRWHASAV